MNVDSLIGQREEQRREFKAGASLANLEQIVREVVAMLNAEGGEIWVGVREEQEIAVAIEGVDEPNLQRARLRDALTDLVEPPPTGDEVRIESVGQEIKILRVQVSPQPDHRPYALRRGHRREFPLRFEDRLRPMTRTEIEEAFTTNRHPTPGRSRVVEPAPAERSLLDDQERVLRKRGTILWLGIEPDVNSGPLDFAGLLSSGLLDDPTLIGDRRAGINIYLTRLGSLRDEPTQRQEAGWLKVGTGSPFQLEIAKTGALRSTVNFDEHPFAFPPEPDGSPFPELRQANLLNPKALVEYPTSLFRFWKALAGPDFLALQRDDPVFASLALVNLEGWYLRPGPTHPAWDYPLGLRLPPPALQQRPRPFTEGRSFVSPVLRLQHSEILASPDRCAVRLAAPVFAAFGWRPDEIPFFDPVAGRLVP